MRLRAVRFAALGILALHIILAVEHFEQQARREIAHLHLCIRADQFHVLDGFAVFLLVLLAHELRHLVVFRHADVETVYHSLVVSSLVLAVYLPQRIGSQTQHQSGDAAVVLRFHPLAVVQGKSSEFYSRNLYPLLVNGGVETLALRRLQVVPCHQRRNASQFGEFHDGVSRSAGIASDNDDLLFPRPDIKSILSGDNKMQGRTEFFYCRKLLVGELVELINLYRGTIFLFRFESGHGLHVARKLFEGNLHYWRNDRVGGIRYSSVAIGPVNVGCYGLSFRLLHFAFGQRFGILAREAGQSQGNA